jgi:hypothetical protein
MRILILDDVEHRHNVFDDIYQGHEVIHAYTYSDFWEKLVEGIWDLIHLDHDLGDAVNADTYVDGWGYVREYNGGHAAMRVCEMDNPPKVIIHSVNPVGSKTMFQMLERRGVEVTWEPFQLPIE